MIGAAGLAVVVLLLVLQALGIGVRVAAPVATLPPAGDAAGRTYDRVVKAVGDASFQVQAPMNAYRPGESPAMMGVPRRLAQVVLPSDPQGGYVVVYELPTNGDAERAGRDFLGYLGSGTGAIQYPRDTRFVLQRVGSTLVFYPWSAEANPDPRVADLVAALETVGEPVRP
jgi:hypothetical protein